MIPAIDHPWQLTEVEATDLQLKLAKQVIKTNQLDTINTIAGVDVAYDKHSDKLVAAVVVLDANTLEVIETASAKDIEQFPYIPGLFSFRELPPLIKAFEQLKHKVDLIVCDGQGYAHPRRFGLACHLGVLFDTPTIGCGKTKLLGEPQDPLAAKRGNAVDLVDNDEVIGRELRTQDNIKPVFISIGHKIDLDTACEWLLKLSPKYRLPETTRQADQLVKNYLRFKVFILFTKQSQHCASVFI